MKFKKVRRLLAPMAIATSVSAVSLLTTLQTPIAMAQQTVSDNNPDAARSCMVDIAILLDASGSIELFNNGDNTPESDRDRNGAYDIIVNSVGAVLNAVKTTGSRVSISSYNATSETHSQFVKVRNGNTAPGAHFDIALGNPGTAQSGIPTNNTGYVDHGISAVSELNERGTNWEAGLSEVRDVIMPGTEMASRPGVPLLVFHFTDGVPNEYNGADGNFIYDPSDTTTPLANAVEVADEIKEDLGAHIVTIAVGGIASTAINKLKAISGPDVHDTANPDAPIDILTDDLILVEEPANLISVMENALADICAPRLAIYQWTQDASGSPVPVQNWDVQVNPSSADATYSWHSPASESNVTSDESGRSDFHWQVSNDEIWNGSDVTIEALDGGDEWILQEVSCEATLGERSGTEIVPALSLNDRTFSVDLKNNEVITCNLYNVARNDAPASTAAELVVFQEVQTVNSVELGQISGLNSYTCPGDEITFTYNVTNNGDGATPDAIDVSDLIQPNVNCPTPTGGQIEGVLSPQETIACTGVYSVTQEDMDAGFIHSIAFASSGDITSSPSEMSIFASNSAGPCPDPTSPETGTGTGTGTGSGTDSTGGENAGGESTDGENGGGDSTGGENAGNENTGSENSGGEGSGSENPGGEDTNGEATGNESSSGESTAGESAGNEGTDNTGDKKPKGKDSKESAAKSDDSKIADSEKDDAESADIRNGDAATATRGAKWFSSNQSYAAACLNAHGGQIELGTLVIRDEAYDDEIDATVKGEIRGDIDTDVESALSMTVGLLNARGGKLSNNRHRGKLARSCARATQQVLVAQCNIALFGAQPSFDLDANVARLAQYCGTESTDPKAKKRVDRVRTRLGKFNRSGKKSALPALDIEVVDSPIQGDDPTDPTD